MIVCNARILKAPLTGVQRYTIEILKRSSAPIRPVQPSDMFNGPLGHIWEQAILPFHTRGQLLWSPGGTGPIYLENQVVTVHDVAPIDCPMGYSSAFRNWYAFVWRQLLPRARGIISVSEFTKRRIVEEFGISADKVHVTPLAVDHTRFVPQPADKIEALRKRLALPENFALFVGALSARKNIVRLLDAWRKYQKPDLHLVIAGGSGLSHVLAGTTQPTPPGNTRLLNRIGDADLPTLIAAARVFVYPSLYEGFGLPLLEAMACGTPCLLANATSLPEVGADAAHYINPLDVDDIGTSLIRLFNDTTLREELRAKGLKRAAEFTWEATATNTFAVLSRYAG